ncbi:Fic family protein [Chryseobacterium sp. POL2]|uniref:Fic family protein n=1 Tax=Chryseobacterium sp. POL2 TaxID=2713414 RepID=UPI0013E16EC5|nr:Fic family protein [Chryseobacterium sp. POL2]QIG89195.1 Fic family protein [Chryseobacterium sp. POL2]
MPLYIHQLKDWAQFNWSQDELINLLAEVRQLQGKLLGKVELLGFDLKDEANLETLIQDVIKTSEIEGEVLNPELVRSSIAIRLGLDNLGIEHSNRNIDGIVDMMLDATQNSNKSLSEDRLLAWHGALFPTGRSGLYKIEVAQWRTGDMQVVSGGMGREKIHFEAPQANRLENEMQKFIAWFNQENSLDSILKAAIAHLWFITIHPFDDGNGRIARAITDMQLSTSDGVNQRFYSMSSQINANKKSYYTILEKTQKGDLDITEWLKWFLTCLKEAIIASNLIIDRVVQKHQFFLNNASKITNERQKIIITKLLEGFEGNLTSSKYAKIVKTSPDTALRDINDLVEKGILLKSNSGGRSTNYLLNI